MWISTFGHEGPETPPKITDVINLSDSDVEVIDVTSSMSTNANHLVYNNHVCHLTGRNDTKQVGLAEMWVP